MKALSMRLRRVGALLLCGMLLTGQPMPAFAATAKALNISFTATTYQNRARDLLKRLNAYRKANGVAQLEMSADLENAAIQRAGELFVFFDHQRPDMSDYDSVLADYPVLASGTAVSELIAAGFSKAEEALADWQSNGDDSLLDADFTHAGIACVYVKGSYNEYYWAVILQQQPNGFKGKAAAATAKAGRSKTMKVAISPDMYSHADASHKRFELRANNLSLKSKQTGTPIVYLYDRYDVKIGRCELSSLKFKSSNTSVFTVTADGTVRRKKTGTGTLTISADGLDAVKCEVTTGSAGSTGSTGSTGGSNSTAVTAATIKQRQPELTVKAYKAHANLSVYVRGASGYVLYRSSSRNGNYTKVTEKATTSRWDYRLEYEDMDKAYYYKVRAYKNSGGKKVYSEYSEEVRVTP